MKDTSGLERRKEEHRMITGDMMEVCNAKT